MDFWSLIYYIDITLFTFVSATVLYLAVFAFASLFSKHTDVPRAKTLTQRLFDITVISDHIDELSNFRLAQQPITLLTPNFVKSSRAKSLQIAINNLPQFKIYDIVVILNAGNIVEPDFLEKMNDAYESAGTKAIQAHRLSQNRDTASARLSSTFEEINNTIFRRGHIALGLSAASAGSAMAFDFEWFKENIMTINTIFDDKELEIRLLRQHIFIDYFDDILVFEEKYRNAEDFNRQRGRWIASQFSNIYRNILHLPKAVFTKHYNLIDKIFQWMLLPRMIMMVIILLMGIILPFIYFTLALKWWALFAFVLLIFAIATPNYLVDEKWDKTFYMLPVIFLSSILSKTFIGKRLKTYVNQKL